MNEEILVPLEKRLVDMYQKVLVPLDGSKAAEMVIPYAEEVAAKFGSQMIIVSVSESVPADTEQLYQAYLERTTEQVQHQLKGWKPDKETRVQSKVLMGKPADEILRYADETNVGLIAMTSRGSSVRPPWLLGNIVAKVLQATSKPVLLIRAPASEAAIQQKRLIKKILLPLDGSELGEAAITYGEALGGALDAELVLFQVVQPAAIVEPTEVGVLYSQPITDESGKASAMDYLNNFRKLLGKRGLKVSSAIAVGSPPDKIIDYTKENAIDLITMSSHGRTGIGRWVFGSVTDKVLHAGDTPVLVVRAPKA